MHAMRPQVGSFPNWDVWGEWNGRFRDDVRRFIKGDPGCKPAFATRLAGSADLYHNHQRCLVSPTGLGSPPYPGLKINLRGNTRHACVHARQSLPPCATENLHAAHCTCTY